MRTPEYDAWIGSSQWHIKAEWFRKSFHHRCAICGWRWKVKTKFLDVHHLTYLKDGKPIFGKEQREDVRCLCRQHHPKGMYPLTKIRRRRMIWLACHTLRWLCPLYWAYRFLTFGQPHS